MDLNETSIWIGLTIIPLIPSIFLAFHMDKSLHEKQPGLRPYAWGYYIGWTGIFTWGLTSILVIFLSFSSNDSLEMFFLGCILIVLAAVYFYIIKRRRWAWVIGTIFLLNPIAWIINGIYMKNRWKEMSNDFPIPIPIKEISLMAVNLFKGSPAVRASIVGSIFWASIVLAYVFMFEPYGRRVLDHEWWLTVKIIIFPPMIAIIGYVLFVKIIKQKD